jgi:hypothetical protein
MGDGEGIPTRQGGPWRPSTVYAILASVTDSVYENRLLAAAPSQ